MRNSLYARATPYTHWNQTFDISYCTKSGVLGVDCGNFSALLRKKSLDFSTYCCNFIAAIVQKSIKPENVRFLLMKVKYIIMKMVDGNSVAMRDVAEMGSKNVQFFEQVIYHADSQIFLAGLKRDKVCSKLKISERTYWKRVHYMEEKGIIKKQGKGIYKLNTNWVRVFDADPKK